MYHFIKQGAARGVVCRPRRGRLGPICTLISAYHISVGILALNLRHERQVQAFILQCAAPKNHLHAKRCDPWQPASANSVGTCSSDGEMLNSLSRAAQHPPSRRRVRVGVPLYAGAGKQTKSIANDQSLTLLQPPSRGPTIHIYLFVTIVGWGKNTLLDAMLPELRGKEPCPTWHLGGGADDTDEETLPGLFEGPDLEPPTILESDTLGAKQFWPAVKEAILRTDDDTTHHLFLNKNFPPNAWQGARKKLIQYCKSANRPVILYAIVPSSRGAERNAFNLVDLGVCLAAIQTRDEHPNLGKESNVTASVAATFYNLYNFRGGRAEFHQRLSRELTEHVIEVDWLSPHAYPRGPTVLTLKMQELLARMGQARRSEKASRTLRKQAIPGTISAGSSGIPRGRTVARGKGDGRDSGRIAIEEQRSGVKAVDEVARTSAALEIECRELMGLPEVAQFLQEARLPKIEMLRSLESGTRRVRKNLST